MQRDTIGLDAPGPGKDEQEDGVQGREGPGEVLREKREGAREKGRQSYIQWMELLGVWRLLGIWWVWFLADSAKKRAEKGRGLQTYLVPLSHQVSSREPARPCRAVSSSVPSAGPFWDFRDCTGGL